MKSLKILFIAVALVMAMPMVTSCSEDEKETEALNPVKGSIVGSWEYSDDIPGDSRMTEKYTFNSDGTFINTWEAYDYVADVPRSGSLSGSYKIENGIISLVYNIADGDNVVETLHISIETDYIKFTDDEGNSMIYYKIDNSQSNPLVGTWEFNCKDGCGGYKEILTFFPNGQLSYYFFVKNFYGDNDYEIIEGVDYGTYKLEGSIVFMSVYDSETFEEYEFELYLEQGVLVDRSDDEEAFYYRQSYDVPSMPDIPQNPSNPDNPSAGKPNTPSNPDQPNTPTNPDEPNNPGLPSSPATNPLVGTWVYTQQNGTVEKQIFTNDYKYTFIHTELVSGEMRDYVDEFTYRIEGISSNQINIIITAIDGSYSDALTFYTDASYSYIKEVYNHPAGPEYGIIEDIYYKQ